MIVRYTGLKGVPVQPYKGPKMRATNKELRNMAMGGRLYVACLHDFGRLMEPRLRLHPGAWRNWRSGLALLGRALDVLYQSIADDQFDRMSAIFDKGILKIDMPLASDSENGVVAVHGDALKLLCESVMRSECAICLKDSGQARSCPIAKALKGCIEPDAWESSTCVWRDQALRNME